MHKDSIVFYVTNIARNRHSGEIPFPININVTNKITITVTYGKYSKRDVINRSVSYTQLKNRVRRLVGKMRKIWKRHRQAELVKPVKRIVNVRAVEQIVANIITGNITE